MTLIFLILVIFVSIASCADCENFAPNPFPYPMPISPILETSIPLITATTLFSWERSDLGECLGVIEEVYDVLVSGDTGAISASDPSICTVSAVSSCHVQDGSFLNDGSTYIWAVKITTNTTTPFFFQTDVSQSGVFTWCIPIVPKIPVLVSQNLTYPYKSVINLEWEPFLANDFGKSCTSFPNSFNIFVSQNNDTTGGLDFSKASSTYSVTIDPDVLGVLAPGVWYWIVIASNGVHSSESIIQNFTVLPPDPILCHSPCQHGTCNTTVGYCMCDPGYQGESCEISGTTAPSAPAKTDHTPLIIGLCVGGGFLIILIIVLAFVYMRITKKSQDLELNILIEPPDFGVLALDHYNLNSTPFVEANSKKGIWKTFEQLVLSEDFLLIHSVLGSAKITAMDSLCSCIVIVFESRGAGSTAVHRLMLKELDEFDVTKHNDNLEANPMPYRGDSAATKAFKVYCRLVGLPYLFETLGQILNDFCALLDGEANQEESEIDNKSTATLNSKRPNFTPSSMEVDPSKMNSEEDETINRLSLQLICQKIFVKIYRSINVFPLELRAIFKKIRDESKKKESLKSINLNVLLSNLVFLRFVNPAIIMPKSFGLVKDEPSDKTKRQLVLITKVLQNLAAGVEFGKKESFMAKLNDFIRSNTGQMNQFLNDLTENINPSGAPSIATYSVPISQLHYNAAMGLLYEYIYANLTAVLNGLRKNGATPSIERILQTLTQVTEELGDPASYGKGKEK